MAKSEILMWVAGILMMVILGLAVAPTITKSGEVAKVAVINSEISLIRNCAVMYQLDAGGTYAGITPSAIKTCTNLNGGGYDPNKLSSRISYSIEYDIMEKAGDPSQFTMEITRITQVLGITAKTSVYNTQQTLATSSYTLLGLDDITLTFRQ